MTALEFEGLLPKHAAGLRLTHNDHKTVYDTVEQHLEDMEGRLSVTWTAEGEREKAIATNELWILHWYPDTPVGFRLVYAASFRALVEWMQKEAGK